jgi:hypothetical protein
MAMQGYQPLFNVADGGASVAFWQGALGFDLTAKGFAPAAPERQDYGLDERYLRDPDGYELSSTSPTRS